MREGFAGAVQVKLLKLVPLGGDHQRVATLGDGVHVLDIRDVLEHGLGFLHGLGIVDAEDGAFLLQAMTQVEGRGRADVIGVLLERQAQHANGLVLQHPERLLNLLHEAVHLRRVDMLNFLQQSEVVADLLGDLDERAEVFREAASAKAQRGMEEASADAFVHAHAVRHFLDVGARSLAQHGDGVDVRDLEREEGIGRVFDQLRGIDVGDDDRGVEGRIDFLERGHGSLGTDADHDAVRMHQVLHGKSLAQELGIADHVEFHARFAVAFDGLGHLVARLDRHRAFIDDDLVAGHRGGDVPRDPLQEAHVHRPVRLGRRGHGDEDHIGLLDALGRARGKREASRGHVLLHQLFETRLVDRDAALLQQLDLRRVIIHTDHLVADLGKASAGDQPDVAGPDDRQLHQRFWGWSGRALVAAGAAGMARLGYLSFNSSSRMPASEPSELEGLPRSTSSNRLRASSGLFWAS